MRRGDVRDIVVDGNKFPATFLGKGHFCSAFRASNVLGFDDRVFCFVDEEDYSKEVFLDNGCGTGPMAHLPEVRKHGDAFNRGVYKSVYSMPYYEPLTAAHKEAWATYRTLIAAREKLFPKYGFKKPLEIYGANFNRDLVEATTGKVPESVTTALDELANAACNWGCGMTMEFAPRNLGVDEEGRIVFRDVLFDAQKLWEERERKMKMTRRWVRRR